MEKMLFDQKYLTKKYILGIDEVGWGCVAGPVVLGGALVPVSFYSNQDLIAKTDFLSNIKDSKKVSEKNRVILYSQIKDFPEWQVFAGIASAEYINKEKLAKAYTQAFDQIISSLPVDLKDVVVLIDGNRNPKSNIVKDYELIIKGDDKSFAIGVASLYAKEFRDEYMRKLDQSMPGYNFSGHKGYGTKDHKESVLKLGLTSEHRTEATTKLISG